LIKGVVFDLDGTLVDSVEIHVSAWLEACKAMGLVKDNVEEMNMENLIRKLVGLAPIDIAYKIVSNSELAKKLAETKQRIYLTKIERVKLFPNVEKSLETLKKMGMKIAIASSVSSNIIKRILELNNIANYIDAYVGSDEVSKRKPEPDIFLKALEKISVKPSEAVIVGDTEYDIIPANKINAISIQICWKQCLETNTKPNFYAKNIEEVIEIIKKLINK